VDEVYRLFPTPLMRAQAALHPELVARIAEHFTMLAQNDNNSSGNLSHTTMLKPKDSPLFAKAAELIAPRLEVFGLHLLGERLRWLMKEMWVNVMDRGGRQAMHNHANSFISGVVYLTKTHPGSQTVFMKAPGGHDFMFKNDHAGTTPGEFCADKWVSPAPEPRAPPRGRRGVGERAAFAFRTPRSIFEEPPARGPGGRPPGPPSDRGSCRSGSALRKSRAPG
jgi:hypothetical protein